MIRTKWTLVLAALLLTALPALMVARAAWSQDTQTSRSDRSQASQPNSAEKKPNQTLKVDVDLVLVNATVTDQLNRYVSGLETQHFQIWEDKVEQKVEYFNAEDVPISVGIIFDVSGSMKEKIGTSTQ